MPSTQTKSDTVWMPGLLNLYECAERPAGGRVYRWMVVSRGYRADDGRSSCGKLGVIIIMSATDENAFEGRGLDPAM